MNISRAKLRIENYEKMWFGQRSKLEPSLFSAKDWELCSLPRTIRLTYGSEPLFSITYLSAHNPSTERCFLH